MSVRFLIYRSDRKDRNEKGGITVFSFCIEIETIQLIYTEILLDSMSYCHIHSKQHAHLHATSSETQSHLHVDRQGEHGGQQHVLHGHQFVP